jgi:hypothetical protein
MIDIAVRFSGVEGMSKRQSNNAVKEAMRDLGRHWREKYLPLHFGPNAGRRYNYTPRQGQFLPRGSRQFRRSYVGRKIRLLKHNNPLEFTGEGKRLALTEEKITATVNKVVIRLPRKFNFRPKNGKVRMADEIRTVRNDELRVLERVLADRVEWRLAEQVAGGTNQLVGSDTVSRVLRARQSIHATASLGAA